MWETAPHCSQISNSVFVQRIWHTDRRRPPPTAWTQLTVSSTNTLHALLSIMLMCNWLIKRQALTGNQEKWFFTETCRSEVTTGLSAIKNVTENHFISKFEFRQQTRCRINNRQTIWMNSIADLKKTLHTHSTQPLTTPATPFPHTCNSVRCARSSGSRKEKKHQAQTVLHQSVWNPVLTSWPQLHKDLQQITGSVRSLLMLQAEHAQNCGDDRGLQEKPPALPPLTIMNSTGTAVVFQIPGHHNFPGPEVGQSHWVHCEKGPAEAVLPSPGEDVQPATGAVDTVLLCHHWIRPLHVNNCLVQLSYQIWPQKTTEGSPDCWANHWYNPLSRNCTYPEWAKGLEKNHSRPSHPAHSLFELLPSGRRYRALSTRTARHRNSFFPQAIHLMNTWH